MRGVSLLVVAALVVAVMVCQADGAELRALIQQQMEGRLRSNAQQLLGARKKNKCKPESKKTESRTCEPPDSVESNKKVQNRCNNCQQQCHAFGDPHLKTFDNQCTTKVFTTPGTWKFFEAPDFTFEVRSGKAYSKRIHILDAYINGEHVMNYKDCGQPRPPEKQTPVTISDTVQLYSDAAKKNGGDPDVTVEYYVGCKYKGKYMSLEVLVTVTDQNQDKSPNKWDRSSTSSDAMTYWSTARGACLDWIGDGGADAMSVEDTEWDCKKTSAIASMDGRQCSCSAECAAYGDPHVTDFQRGASNEVGKAFLMPKSTTWNEWESIMYTAEELFAVSIAVDECEFVAEATVYMMKNETMKRFTACDKNRPSADDLTLDDYDVVRIKADEYCAGSTKASSTGDRETITIPSMTDDAMGAAYFDQDTQGFNMGRQAMYNGEIILLDGSANEEPTEMAQCLKQLGYGDSAQKNSEEVYLGGGSVILKCHQRPDSAYYFNICVNRRGLRAEITGSDAWDQTINNDLFTHVEKASKTGGWCATGDLKKGSSSQASTMQMSSFENRGVEETSGFTLLDGGTSS